MNKTKDIQVYLDLDRRLRIEDHSLEKRKLLYSRMVKLSPFEAGPYYSMIGHVLHNSDEYQKSLFPFKKAIIFNPENTFAQVYLANSFLELGKENECFFTFQKALSVYPRDSTLHAHFINVLRDQNKLRDLSFFYQETAVMMKDKKDALDLYYHGAKLLENAKMILQALELYEKASETNLMTVDQRTQYAEILNREGLFEEAIVQYEDLWKLEPTNFRTINNIASLHYELGRVEKTFKVFEEIIKGGLQTMMTFPNFVLVLYHLGKDEEAMNISRKVIQDYPQIDKDEIQQSYIILLRGAEKKLESDIDEKAREFYTKKVKALNMILSLLNSPQE